MMRLLVVPDNKKLQSRAGYADPLLNYWEYGRKVYT
jgi:hypothetical protein